MVGDTASPFFGGNSTPSLIFRIWVFSALTLTAYLITYHGIQHGITDVYPFLFFIPIIIAAFFFPRRETIIAVAVALGYFGLVYSLAGHDVWMVYTSTINFTLFVLFGLLVSSISEKVRSRSRRYSGVLEQAKSCNWIIDRRSGTIQDINSYCVHLLDYIPHDLHGRPMRNLWQEQEKADTLLEQIEQSLGVGDQEAVLVGKDGRERFVRVSGSILDDETIGISAVDITPLKMAEQKLSRFEATYQATLNSIPEPVLVVDRHLSVILHNSAAARGYQQEEGQPGIIGKNIEDIYPFLSFLRDPECVEKIFLKKIPVTREVRHEEDGVLHWYDTTIHPLGADDGRDCATVIIEDITQRKNTESLWKKTEAAHRAIFENAGAGILILDEDGQIHSVNDEFCMLTGYQKEDITGETILSLFQERDQQVMQSCLLSRQDPDLHEEYEVQIIAADGDVLDCMLLTAHIADTTHRIVSIIDITEEHRMLELIRDHENNYEQLVSNLPVGVFIIVDGSFQFVNPALCSMTGYSWEDFKNQPISFLFPESGLLFSEKQPGDRGYATKDGTGRMGEVVCKKYLHNGEEVTLGILLDTTQRTILEDTLRREIEWKSDFVMIASHELRTPLQPVMGYLSLLLHDPDGYQLSGEVVQLLWSCQNNLEQERRIIDRMIDLSIADSASLSPNLKEVSIYSLIEELLADHGCRQLAMVSNDLPETLTINGDPALLYQVFHSLLSNAVRFSDPPRTISLGYTSDSENHFIHVADNGYGIDEIEKCKIFAPFYITDSEQLSRTYDRLGIGLSIADRYVRLHGGGITLESRVGDGSIFTVRLPMVIQL
ncbi:MAG: PAS domain S-box protein [Methanocalculus sp. MSAO_Arc1]|uniref:PAS domain-containing sensor histidine kinase n=1 Tax=Methanocalculus TaxID=71151 RepID=UPI000FF57B49|nr:MULTISPECIES: PAS domain S-box protein [unclassified Methanocalculus]MCP1662012.1 PAS domain S-box-containing protein [Methanocalculus sp. AMF5]RQD79622.1 MAG: PAS domain S-box protein [Methanocalculus sp. MSAO_Arc1]